jgi:cell division protein FtsZ
MSAGDRKLDEFPYSEPGFGRKVAVVGIGSCGCRITNEISKGSRLIEHCLYVSCDDQDVANISRGEKVLVDVTSSGKGTPFNLRGVGRKIIPEMKRQLVDSQIVIIIAGLGGSVGSGLAPLVAQIAKENQSTIVSILVMPYAFEKPKHYFAGLALRQMRDLSSGVIIVDNDQLYESEIPAIEANAIVNEKIALALNKLLGSGEQQELCIGLNNVVDFVKTNSYSVLSLGESEAGCRLAVTDAVTKFDKTVNSIEAMKSLVHICTDNSITMKEVALSIGGLSGVLGNGTMQVEYGLSVNSSTLTTAAIVATGFSGTKYDEFDPVGKAIKSAWNMDTEPDSSLDLQLGIQNLE